MLAITPTPKSDVQQLYNILETQRPSGSQSEIGFVRTQLLSIKGATQDGYGNVFVEVLMDQSSTMFSCHTDTVHPKPHPNYKNNLVIDPMTNHLFTDGKSQLGADDGTGIWFMLNMIEAKVPGLYVFHRDEEVGGLGSSASAEANEDYLTALGLKRCVAFDRHYYEDVITHQGGRCASDEFAQALSDQLNITPGFKFKPCDTGVFTDSANYTHLIPECTNLSVGYWSQHTIKETQDIGFAEKLLDRLLQIDWEALPTERDVTDESYPDDLYGYNERFVVLSDCKYMDIEEICIEFPEEVASALREINMTDEELRTMIMDKQPPKPKHNVFNSPYNGPYDEPIDWDKLYEDPYNSNKPYY